MALKVNANRRVYRAPGHRHRVVDYNSRSMTPRNPDPADGSLFTEARLRELLAEVALGKCDVEGAMSRLRSLPYDDVGCAALDHHRELRKGFPEVVYCQHKKPAQVAQIIARLAQHGGQVLGTRADAEHFAAAKQVVPELCYDEAARCIFWDRQSDQPRQQGIALVAAGTSDLPVAQEAAVTLRLMGQEPLRITDVGVAGLHRLMAHLSALQKANVIIAVAGMEGALPSVIAGLVSAPVIAVPTSVGYGASFGGIAALLGMLNACAPGISVVNIDNGFGAAFAAAAMNRRMRT